MIDDIIIRHISVPYIIVALNDERINVKLAALENVKIKDKKIYEEICTIIKSDENKDKIILLSAALKAINGYLLDRDMREIIIGFLTHPFPEIRIASLGVLKKDRELQKKNKDILSF